MTTLESRLNILETEFRSKLLLIHKQLERIQTGIWVMVTKLCADISHLSARVERLSSIVLVGATSCSTVVVGGFTAIRAG
jgi:hypothetical protein